MSAKLVIVGGVAGGATAATRARRLDEHAEIVLFERGEHISFANCGLPYYIGGIIKERDDLLVATPELLRSRYNINIRNLTEVTGLDRSGKRIKARNVATDEEYWESYDKLILSPGAEPIKPPLEGADSENVFTLRNIPDTDGIKAWVDEKAPESAVVVGGGFIGLEMAENLAERGIKVSVVEMLDQVMTPLDFEMASVVQAHLRERGVELYLNNGVKSIQKKGARSVVKTADGTEIECDMIILSVGIRPENKLAREAGLELGKRGGIKVDSTLLTSDPHIYAIGDAVEIRDYITGRPVMTPLAGPANKQGRIAADNALGRKSVFRGTMGTSVVKIFDMQAAATGCNEKVLADNGIPYMVSYTHSNQHSGYYPGAEMMSIKLLFSPGDGRLLGAQAVGKEGVDKRIDVLATAIRGKMTVFDLEELELAYAPPYGSAKDAVNIAGFVAANLLKNDVKDLNWNELAGIDDGCALLDVRDKEELDELGTIEGSTHIPLSELRGKLSDLDKNKTYVPFCAIGLRGYLAYRILTQNGFKTLNLAGGYKTYLGARGKIMRESEKAASWKGKD